MQCLEEKVKFLQGIIYQLR